MGRKEETEPYILVYDWMFHLGMTWNEVIIYALVYGYYKSGLAFFASEETTARRLGMHTPGVCRAIGHLKEKGLMRTEKEIGTRYTFYYPIVPDSVPSCYQL